jgi:hypothetical protein
MIRQMGFTLLVGWDVLESEDDDKLERALATPLS